MEAGSAARTVEHGRLQVVEDDAAGTTTEELESMHQAAVEFGFVLRECELDVHQPAIAEHGYEHRNLARCRPDLHAAAFAPIDLHRLSRLVVDFLVDPSASGTSLPKVA